MNFVPAIPQVSQQGYGQGYGNWQQYAGYSKNNPFGSSPELIGKKPNFSNEGVPAPVADLSQDTEKNSQPKTGIDYSIAPSSNGTMGASSMESLGGSLSGQSNVNDDILKAFGVGL